MVGDIGDIDDHEIEPAANLTEGSARRASMRPQAVHPEHDKRPRHAGRKWLGKHMRASGPKGTLLKPTCQ
jgi:hypothetical protein